MQSVARWGNSLAVRLPAAMVRQLGLKPGDKIELRAAGDDNRIDIVPDLTREDAVAEIKAMKKWKLPDGYRFDRDEANARGDD